MLSREEINNAISENKRGPINHKRTNVKFRPVNLTQIASLVSFVPLSNINGYRFVIDFVSLLLGFTKLRRNQNHTRKRCSFHSEIVFSGEK